MKNTYSKEVMAHFLHPKYVGEMKKADGVGKVGNVVCGDVIKVFIRVESGKIKEMSFLTFGCAAAISVADALCEMVRGKTLSSAKRIRMEEVIKKLKGLPTMKVHCSSLAIDALHKAIEDYQSKNKKLKQKN